MTLLGDGYLTIETSYYKINPFTPALLTELHQEEVLEQQLTDPPYGGLLWKSFRKCRCCIRMCSTRTSLISSLCPVLSVCSRAVSRGVRADQRGHSRALLRGVHAPGTQRQHCKGEATGTISPQRAGAVDLPHRVRCEESEKRVQPVRAGLVLEGAPVLGARIWCASAPSTTSISGVRSHQLQRHRAGGSHRLHRKVRRCCWVSM